MKSVILVNGERYEISETKYFVSCTDKFMSGWGLASGKIAKRVIICNNRAQAFEMIDRLSRPKNGMKRVNYSVGLRPPYYTPSKYIVTFDLFTDNLFNF